MRELQVSDKKYFLDNIVGDTLAKHDVLYWDDSHGKRHLHINPELSDFEALQLNAYNHGVDELIAISRTLQRSGGTEQQRYAKLLRAAEAVLDGWNKHTIIYSGKTGSTLSDLQRAVDLVREFQK